MKIEIDIKDQRVERLLKEMGPKGFGVYVMICLLMKDRVWTHKELVDAVNKYTGRQLTIHVISDYGLFRIEDGDVRMCAYAPVPARTGECPCEACAPVPITDYLVSAELIFCRDQRVADDTHQRGD